jgi:hypothetical protein
VQKHYALKISIVATDSNVETGPGTATASPLYNFLIVSENQLLALMTADQRKYYELLYQTVQELGKSRDNLESELFAYRKSAEDPVRLLLRSDAARKAARDGGITTKAVLVRYESLLNEMIFNRMTDKRIEKLKDRIVAPLAAVTAENGSFAKTEDLVGKLYKGLSPDADKKEKADMLQQGNDPALIQELLANKDKHIKNAEMSLVEMNELIRQLNLILDVIGPELANDRLIEDIERIEAGHRLLDQTIRGFQQRWREWLIEQITGGKTPEPPKK